MDVLRGQMKFLAAALTLALMAPAAGHGAGCNNAPVAFDDIASIQRDVLVVDVLANDEEPDGEAMTATLTGVSTCKGLKSVDQGLVRYEPDPSLDADCTIAYEVRDEAGNVATATLMVKFQAGIFADDFESGNTSAWSQ